MTNVNVVLIEDDDDDAELLSRTLGRSGLPTRIRRVTTAEEFRSALQERPDAVIADYSLPHFSARAALAILGESALDIPLLVVSGSVGEDTAVALMRAGAADCVMKGNLSRLVPAIERELREAEVRRRQREADARARRYAWFDEETNLPNRNRLVDEMRARLAAGAPFHLALLTIDRVQEVLRTLGHAVVDQIVSGTAERLARVSAERGWFVARVGGREFAVLASAEAEAPQSGVLAGLGASLDHAASFDALTLDVRVRAGLVRAPEDGAAPFDLLRRAETALDTALRTGRRAAVYSPAEDPWSPRRLTLMNDLTHAAGRGELALVFQPRVRLRGRRVVGVEALLRWRHPQLGAVPPDEFIPLAEGTGQIHAITQWVIAEAARQCVEWRSAGLELSVGINVSARSLCEADVSGQLAAQLRASALPPHMLHVEVTESALMTDPTRALAVLTELRDQGVHVFLDDFGIGYSSLGYLRSLPLHALKIDRTFVSGGLLDRNDSSIVQATVQLAHNLGLAVVAEGVETADVLSRLDALGCDEVQGYFVCKPMPGPAVAEWCHTSPWGHPAGPRSSARP